MHALISYLQILSCERDSSYSTMYMHGRHETVGCMNVILVVYFIRGIQAERQQTENC